MDISSVFDRQIIFDKFVKTKSKLQSDNRYKKAIAERGGDYFINISINNRYNRIIFNYIKYIFSIIAIIGISVFITKVLYSKLIPSSRIVNNFYNIIIFLFIVFMILVAFIMLSVQSDNNIIDSLISLVIVLNYEGALYDKEHREKTISYLHNNRDSIGGVFKKIMNYAVKSKVFKYYSLIPPFFITILTAYFSNIFKLGTSESSDDMFLILSLIFSLFITLSMIYLLLYISLYMLIKSEIWDDELYKISLDNLLYICTLKKSDEIISYLYFMGTGDGMDKILDCDNNDRIEGVSSLDKQYLLFFRNFLWNELKDKSYHLKIKILVVIDLIYSFLYLNCNLFRNDIDLSILYLLSVLSALYLKYEPNDERSVDISRISVDKQDEVINSVYQSLDKIYNKSYVFKVSLMTILLVLIIPKFILLNDFSNDIININEFLILCKSSLMVVLAVVIIYRFIRSVRIKFLVNVRSACSENKS